MKGAAANGTCLILNIHLGLDCLNETQFLRVHGQMGLNKETLKGQRRRLEGENEDMDPDI